MIRPTKTQKVEYNINKKWNDKHDNSQTKIKPEKIPK